jgi:hypothetical protein
MSERVRVVDLLRRPRHFDGRRITAVGLWRSGFESSWFAGAWLTRPESWPYSGGRHEQTYVRVTGTWRAGTERVFGHLGIAKATLEADAIERIPLVTTSAVGPGELAAQLDALEGELVNATVPFGIGHEWSVVDGIPLTFPVDRDARDPIERLARVVVWVERGTLAILETAWLGEPRAVPIPHITADELPAHRGRIVDVSGELSTGEYWPRLGDIQLVPPEVTTTARAALAYGRMTPEPDEVLQWRARLAAGPMQVRARGTMTRWHFSAYRLDAG